MTNKEYLFNTLEKPFTERRLIAKITHISVPQNQCLCYNISSFCPPAPKSPFFSA